MRLIAFGALALSLLLYSCSGEQNTGGDQPVENDNRAENLQPESTNNSGNGDAVASVTEDRSMVVGNVQNGVGVLTADASKCQTGFHNWWVNTVGLNSADLTVGTVEIVSQPVDGGSAFALLAPSDYNENGVSSSRLAGIQLEELENGDLLLIAGGISQHSCSGNPCSACKFTYASNPIGLITGCECERNDGGEGDGHCDHTVSTGGAAGSLPNEIMDALES